MLLLTLQTLIISLKVIWYKDIVFSLEKVFWYKDILFILEKYFGTKIFESILVQRYCNF